MTYGKISLNDAMLLVNPEDKSVYLVNKQSVTNYSGYIYAGGARSSAFKMTSAERLLMLYIDAWHAVFVHGASPQEVDAALRVVSEYKETLTGDFPPANHAISEARITKRNAEVIAKFKEVAADSPNREWGT